MDGVHGARQWSKSTAVGQGFVATRCQTGSGNVLETSGQAVRVGVQWMRRIGSTTAAVPRRRWGEFEARDGVMALLCGAAAAEAR